MPRSRKLHWHDEHKTERRALLARTVAELAGVEHLVVVLGIDTAALDWLAEHARASLTVVVRCTVIDQPAAASDAIRPAP